MRRHLRIYASLIPRTPLEEGRSFTINNSCSKRSRSDRGKRSRLERAMHHRKEERMQLNIYALAKIAIMTDKSTCRS